MELLALRVGRVIGNPGLLNSGVEVRLLIPNLKDVLVVFMLCIM